MKNPTLLSVSDEMLKALEQERKARKLESIPEAVRAVLGGYFKQKRKCTKGLIAFANATTPITPNLDGFTSFFSSELFAVTFSAIIAVLITYIVQSYLDRPKVRGSILNFISAEVRTQFQDVRKELNITLVCPYVLLTNQHQNAISLLDFIMEVNLGKGWLKMEKLIADEKFYKETLPQAFVYDAGERIIRFPNLDKALLERKLRPIKYGDYLHGFLLFGCKTIFLGTDIKRARLTCVDVFQNRHVIMFPQRKWWQRLFGKKEVRYPVPNYIFEQNAGAVSEWKK